MKERKDVRREGERLRRELFGTETPATVTGSDDLVTEITFGSIWNRAGLALHERMLVTLSALFVRQQNEQLRRYIGAALRIGVTPLAINEVLLQCGIYSGFSAAEQALAMAGEVYTEHGQSLPENPRRESEMQNLRALGQELMRELHGERRHEGHAAPDNPTTGSFYPLVVQYCYGEIWHRPGLDRRTRALCAVAAFAALGYTTLLRKFALSALNVGATREEVIESIVQIGPYTGFATTLNALSQVNEVYASR